MKIEFEVPQEFADGLALYVAEHPGVALNEVARDAFRGVVLEWAARVELREWTNDPANDSHPSIEACREAQRQQDEFAARYLTQTADHRLAHNVRSMAALLQRRAAVVESNGGIETRGEAAL